MHHNSTSIIQKRLKSVNHCFIVSPKMFLQSAGYCSYISHRNHFSSPRFAYFFAAWCRHVR